MHNILFYTLVQNIFLFVCVIYQAGKLKVHFPFSISYGFQLKQKAKSQQTFQVTEHGLAIWPRPRAPPKFRPRVANSATPRRPDGSAR